MNNTVSFKDAHINVSSDCKVIKLGEFSSQDPSEISVIENIGKRGLGVWFNPGDEIVFPSEEECTLFIDGFETSTGERRLALSCMAYCERYKFFAMPMAIFRRTPLMECQNGETVSEFERLLEGNDFGAQLLRRQADVDRVHQLCGKTIKVIDRLILHQPAFGLDDKNNLVRIPDKFRSLVCFKWDVK